jgi:hypothetical protein
MRKVIRLTESDIIRIVKRVIKEEKLSKEDVLKKQVLKRGWEFVSNHIGFDNLYKIAFDKNYHKFLNLFNNLEVVQSELDPNLILYRFEKGKNIMVYRPKNGVIHFDFKIRSFFETGIGLKPDEIKIIMKKWLSDTNNLNNITPYAGLTKLESEII